MKTLEVIEPLTEAEQIELARLERIVAKNEVAAVNYLEALACIRNGKLYRAEAPTWAEYCEKKWGKSYRAINLAIQAETVRKEMGRTSSQMSDNAALALEKVEPKKRKAVIAKVEKSGEKITPGSIRKAAGLPPLAPAPTRDYSGAYSSAPKEPTPAEAFGGDEPEEDADALTPVTDAESAVKRLEQVYEMHKEWMNAVPPRLPRQILDRLIEGVRL